MNLKKIHKGINHEELCQNIEKEFKAHYKDSTVYREILNYESLKKTEKIDKIFQELKSEDWLYIQTPAFTNQFEKQFPWGNIDFYVEVKNGAISNGQVYSDCLYPDFIDFINSIIKK
jgi:hypothetical protein